MIRIIAHFAASIIANALILFAISEYVPELGFAVNNLSGGEVYVIFPILGAIFRLFNIVIKKIIKIVAMPLALLTFGLSSVIINIAIIYVFGYVINTNTATLGIQVEVGTIVQTLILSIVISFAYFILKKAL